VVEEKAQCGACSAPMTMGGLWATMQRCLVERYAGVLVEIEACGMVWLISNDQWESLRRKCFEETVEY